MKTRLAITFIGSIIAVVVVVTSCSKTTSPNKNDPAERIRELVAQTPRAEAEAELAALVLSKKFVAPESLYVEIRDALRQIRKSYDTSRELSSLHVVHPWGMRQVLPELDSVGLRDYRHGNHHSFDSLTELLNGEIADTTYFNLGDHEFLVVKIEFPGFLNSDSVEAMYKSLPGVAGIDHYFMIDSPNVYPWRLGDGRVTLLFREAWGDCYAGCGCSHFWYFRVDPDSIDYVGDYLTCPEDSVPTWWDEAKVGMLKFIRGN